MSEPAQTTLTFHSSLAAFVLLLIAALLFSAPLALHAACVRRVRACAHASLVCVRAAVPCSALAARHTALLCPTRPLHALLILARSRSLSLSHCRFGEMVGEVPSIARLRYRGLR